MEDVKKIKLGSQMCLHGCWSELKTNGRCTMTSFRDDLLKDIDDGKPS